MVEDTKMEDAEKKEEDDEKKVDGEETKEDDKAKAPLPPLEAAARRLERLLGGGLSEGDRQLYTYANPVKLVRRWMGTASGAAGKATPEDIVKAAAVLLDPSGTCSKGRDFT
mgnify:CR=1 FL=1